MEELTERQRKVLTFIRESIEQNGTAPCYREIGEAVGLSSKSSVAFQISRLRKLGHLRPATGPCQPIRLPD